MKNFLVIAAQDRGKSFFIKNDILKKLRKRKNYICDINNEYTDFVNEYDGIFDREEFFAAVPTHKDASVNVVCEESTMFFSRSGSQPKSTMTHITRRFHSNNVNVFVFHSLGQVPSDILMHMDFIVLFRTDDDPDYVRKEFANNRKLLNAFNEVREKTNGTAFERKNGVYLPGYYYDKDGERVEVSAAYSKKWFHHKLILSK